MNGRNQATVKPMALEIAWERVVSLSAATVTGLLAWIGRRQIARIDRHDERLNDLERTRLTKGDIDEMEARLTTTIQLGSAHVSERLGDVKATAEKAHERIDRLGH